MHGNLDPRTAPEPELCGKTHGAEADEAPLEFLKGMD
jgi:hypothetical protein